MAKIPATIAQAEAAASSAEQALRALEQRLRSTLDSALDAVVTIDQQGKIIDWNAQAERTFGWSRDEVLGQPMAELIVPHRYRAAHREGLKRFHATGDGPVLDRRLELSALRRSGEEFPVELTISSLKLPKAYQFAAHIRDISERKAAEAALRESEERSRAIVEALPAAIYTCDADGKIKLFNKAAVELWGREPEVGRDRWCGWWKIFTPEGERLPHHLCPMARVLSEGRAIHGEEIVIERTDGERRHILAHPEPLLSEDGKLVGAINMLLDITERKQTEQALADSQSFLQSTLDSLSSHVAVLDEKGFILMVNEAWQQFAEENGFLGNNFGIGGNYLDVCDKSSTEGDDQAIQAANGIREVLSGKRMSFALEYACHSPGEQRWFQMRVTRFVASGRASVVVAHDDVTQRRQAEQAARDSEQFLRRTLDGMIAYTGVCDRDGRLVFANQVGLDAGGVQAEDVLGRPFVETVWWKHDAAVRKQIEQCLRRAAAGETARIQTTYWHASNEIRNVDFQAAPMPNDAGEIVNLVVSGLDVTDRWRAEQAQRASEELARLLLSSTGEAIYGLDLEGRCTFCNPACVRLLGYENEEALLGRDMHSLIHHTRPDGSPYPSDQCPIYTDARRGENVHVDEEVLWRADGSSFPAEYWSQPIHRGDKIVGVVVTFVDVADRKLAEETRARLAAIIESSEDAVIGKTLDGTVTSWNRGAERLYGYTSEEMVGAPITRLAPPDRYEEIRSILDRLRRNEQVAHFETVRVRKDGTLIDISLTVSPIHDSNGTIVGASAIARDITQRKRAELVGAERNRLIALRGDISASLAQTQTMQAGLQRCCEWLVHHLDVAFARIWVLHDIDHVLELQGSAGLYKHLDGPHSRIKLGDLKIGRIAAEQQPHLTNDVPNDPNISDPEWARREGMVAFAGYPLLVGARCVGVVGMFARKAFSETVLSELSPLAEVIAQYINRKKYEQQLLDADRHKDDFIAMLAHELRNPLAPIRNATQVFELIDLGDPTLIEMRDVIKRQVQHMARLLDDLLDVSRIARGKVELKREPVDLCELVHTTAEDLRGTFAEQGIELTLDVGDQPFMTEADPTRISQCVGNLLHNACKFTEAGGRVEASVSQNNDEAVIRIRDTGVGMEPGFIEHLFEPFRQADRSLHRSPGGLGLGLAMVRGLVELHGGRVYAASEGVGEGSEFVIHLPLETRLP